MGDDIALAQVVAQYLDQAVHDVVLPDVVHVGVLDVADHDDAQEHGGAEAFEVAHLEIVDLLEHVVIAHEGAAVRTVVAQLVANGVHVELERLPGAVQLVVEGLHALAGLRAKIAVGQVGGVAVLLHGVADVVQVDHRLHQLDVQALVEAVDVQGLATDHADLVVGLVLAQQLQILIHGVEVLAVHLLDVGGLLVQVAGLVQIALVQAQEALIQGIKRRLVAGAAELVEDIQYLQRVDPDAVQQLPVVRAAVRHDALAQPRRDLVQHRPDAADQRFKRVFGVGHGVARPKLPQEALVGNGLAAIQYQKRHQSRALAGLAHGVFDVLLVDVEQVVPHQLYPDAVFHGCTPIAL